MKTGDTQKRVLIALGLAGTAGRRHLAGILKYVNNEHPWSIRIIGDPNEFTPKVLAQETANGLDGILCFSTKSTAESLAATSVPTGVLDLAYPILNIRRKNIAFAVGAEEANGALGARYFRSLGKFMSYGYVPDPDQRGFSRLRERGFREELRKCGCRPDVFDAHRQTLAEWVQSLPKPAAILAAFDFLAVDVLEVCRKAKVTVPSQVCVLGIDNDEILCENSIPTLSSIRLDHEQEAYDLARELDRMMRSRNPVRKKVLTGREGMVVERCSTTFVENSTQLAHKALTYIKAHAGDGITASDVISYLCVSKSLAYSTFSRVTGKSLHKAIEEERLKRLMAYLESPKLSISKASVLAGYGNQQRAKYVFKAKVGISMREWRKAQGVAEKPSAHQR